MPVLPRTFLFTIMIVAVAAVSLTVGCSQDLPTVTVDLDRRVSAEQVENPPAGDDALRVAIAAIFSPQQSLRYYHDLLEYIGSRIGRSVYVTRRKTYQEINTLIGRGDIDLAFICSGPYVMGKDVHGFRPLAVPIIRNKETYRSYLIVKRDSTIDNLDQLRGKTMAFTDPDSNTGCLVPQYLLLREGETDADFFGKTIYTHSHDNSIVAVSRSLVDGAFVHEQIWEYLNSKHPDYTDNTRVILRSEPFGNPPIVASPKLPPPVADRIRQLLLGMHNDPEGRRILNHLMVARFVPVQERLYDPVRRIVTALNKKEAPDDAAQKP